MKQLNTSSLLLKLHENSFNGMLNEFDIFQKSLRCSLTNKDNAIYIMAWKSSEEMMP